MEWEISSRVVVVGDGGSYGEYSSVEGGDFDGFFRVWMNGGCGRKFVGGGSGVFIGDFGFLDMVVEESNEV